MEIKIVDLMAKKEREGENTLLLFCENEQQKEALSVLLVSHLLRFYIVGEDKTVTIAIRLSGVNDPIIVATGYNRQNSYLARLIIDKQIKYVSSAYKDEFGVIKESLLHLLNLNN